MSTYVNMQDGPIQVVSTGMQLKGLVTDFQSQASGILAEIKSIEGGQPWGDDDAGKAFLTSYNQVPPHSNETFSASMHDTLANAGKDLGEISDNIVNTVANYQSTDVDGSEAILNV